MLLTGAARAGGHLDVDDAGTLDPGQCQYESWYGRAGPEPATGFHIGPACRVGPVEFGLNLDRFRVDGEPHALALGPQIKWTWFGQAPDARFSAAVSAGATWDRTHRGKPGRQLVFPFTWRAADDLQIHVNLGADWVPVTGTRTGRGGLGTEWALNEHVSLLAERNRAFGQWTSRAGVRVSLSPFVSIDLTAAQTSRTGPGHARGFFVGVNHEFTRP
ncbi:MAG: hypothetical protein EOO29_35285 [Comamonadaceae bacterium]|nr:MAG: hypothetical protein EOO29_35285 [Comamonadaceae bacterium]